MKNSVVSGRDQMTSPTLNECLKTFFKIGVLSFGGPAAQISLMHKELVEDRSWLSEKQFLNALSFCMLLPGPEAMQLATYSGWRLRGVIGGLLAGLLFVLPGAFVVLSLAILYSYFGDLPLMQTLFLGVKAAVLIIVIEALLKVAKKALLEKQHWILAGSAFVGIFFLSLPFPVIITLAAIYGYFSISPKPNETVSSVLVTVSLANTARTIIIWLAIWWLPIFAIYFVFGGSLLFDIGTFFSKLAVVTFGGAYAVLAYMAQDVVSNFGWLTAGEMLDGLGLAETTPGPLILVNEFVGFLAAFKQGGIWLGIAGAVIALWVTFTPCFLWIFAGAPYIEWISAQPRLAGALSAITASVVGVILNLSIWFGLHVVFGDVLEKNLGLFTVWLPDLTTFDWRVLLLALLSALLLLKFHLGVLKTLIAAATAAWVLSLVF